MDATVTVSAKGVLATALVVLALVTAYLLGGAGGAPATPARATPAAAEPAGDDARTLRMVGTGEATVVPDMLGFTLSVSAEQPELDDALGRASGTMRRVLAELRDQGVRDADVQTTGLQMYPEYDYPAYGPPVLTGYRVTQRARVTVRELADGGEAVSTAVETGGNGVRVTDIRLGVSDPERALGEARDAAVADATAKAEQYAAATGQTLGDVLGLRELSGSRPRPQPVLSFGRAAQAADLAAVPVKAGRDDLEVGVEVVWAFE
jgi:hypothetical protein